MLKQRILTALVLLAVLLPALFAQDQRFFNALVLLMLGAGAWEWGRLNGLKGSGIAALGSAALITAAAGAAVFYWGFDLHLIWIAASAVWFIAAVPLLRGGVEGWGRIPFALRWTVGAILLWVTALAMIQARALGVNFLLSVLALVWTADICAYFAGRAFGLRVAKVKLAPSISPGKSWEGAIGGALGVALLAAIWVWQDERLTASVPSLYTLLYREAGLVLMFVACAVLTAMSVVGDLTESLVKRSAGMKDSSQLLPGHGGVLDRIDALLPTLPMAMCLASALISK